MIVKLGYEPKTEEEKAEFDRILDIYVDELKRIGMTVTAEEIISAKLQAKTTLAVLIPGRPVPAVRTTGKQMWKDPRYAKYHEYKERVSNRIIGEAFAEFEHMPYTEGQVTIKCDVYIQGGVFGDVDNYLKSCLDSIQLSRLIKNDKQVIQAEVERHKSNSEEERMEIKISWMEG